MVTIRPATPEDFAAIGELTTAAYVTSGHVAPDDIYAQELVDMAARAHELYVADVDGRVAGAVNIVTAGSAHAQVAYDNEGEFRMLAVAPGYQGRGIGRALVQFVLDWAQARGLRQVALTTMPSMTAAQAMYEAMGFQRAPERDWNLYTAGYVEDPEGLETFLVYVYPLNSTTSSKGDSWLTT